MQRGIIAGPGRAGRNNCVHETMTCNFAQFTRSEFVCVWSTCGEKQDVLVYGSRQMRLSKRLDRARHLSFRPRTQRFAKHTPQEIIAHQEVLGRTDRQGYSSD